MTTQPIVSVIISTYNSEQFFVEKLNDLTKQSIFPDIEIIVINSGSLQAEHELIKPFLETYPNIIYIRTPNRETIYRAFNRGIKAARGKYITNSNTDDRLRFDALEILSRALEEDPTIGLVYADQVISNIPNENFESACHNTSTQRPNYTRLRLLSYYFLGSQSMWRASIHTTLNFWFNEEFEVAGDYYFALLISEHFRIKRVKEVLGVYYQSKLGTNKEFQNIDQTTIETAQVRDFFAKRFFMEAMNLYKFRVITLIQLLTSLPEFQFRIINKIINLLSPRSPLLPYDMAHYFKSIELEINGDIKRALAICKKFKSSYKSHFLEIRITSLVNKNEPK